MEKTTPNRRLLVLTGLLTAVTVICFCSWMTVRPKAPLAQQSVADLIHRHRHQVPVEYAVVAEFRQRGAAVVPFLIEDLWAKDTWIKRTARNTLAGLPNLITRWITPPLPLAQLRQKSLNVLAEMGPTAREAIPELTRVLTEGDPALHAGAARALASMGLLARPAIPALGRAATSADAPIRGAALWALPAIAPSEPVVWDILRQALDDPSPNISRFAAIGLLGVRPPESVNLPDLLGKLRRPEWARFITAPRLAHWLGANAEPLVPELITLVHDESIPDPRNNGRGEILDALRQVGPAAQSARAAVEPLCESTNGQIRAAATMVMAGLAGRTNAAVAACLFALEQTGRRWGEPRYVMLNYLAELGPAARAATPVIRALLKDCPHYDRMPALRALWKIEGDAVVKEVVLVASSLLESTSQDEPRQAAELLGQMGPLAAGALPELLRAIKLPRPQDMGNETAIASVRAIENIDPAWLEKIGRERTR